MRPLQAIAYRNQFTRGTGINLPVDTGFIFGSAWEACSGLREAP